MTASSPAELTEAQAVAQVLAHCHTVAVVGLSPKVHRESYRVAQYLQAQGWTIVPINPVAAASGQRILGELVYASLTEAAQQVQLDLVNVFRNSDDVPPVVDEAIGLGLKTIWLQLGIRHDAALARARAAGMVTVQDRCLMVDHARQRSAGAAP